MKNEYESIENEIKEDLEKVVSEFFKQFLNKFDNFSNQMNIAQVLLKAYQYRYDKFKQKFSNVNDVIASNYEDQKEFLTKVEKLEIIDAKLTQVEVKLHNLAIRVDSVDKQLESKSIDIINK